MAKSISRQIDIYYVEGAPFGYHDALAEAQAIATARLKARMGRVGATVTSSDIARCTVKVMRSDGTIATTVCP